MKQPKSYEKDEFTTVIESLSTSSEDETEQQQDNAGRDAPFPRDEAHVTILSEIEKRLSQFPGKVLLGVGEPGKEDTALVLYRSPESMGLPPLERQKQEEAKVAMRKRIMERRRLEKMGVAPSVNYKVQVEEEVHEEEEGDGYEADAEDLEDDSLPESGMPNGFKGYRNQVDEYDDDDDDGEMMDLD
jgi:hypothetical protein